MKKNFTFIILMLPSLIGVFIFYIIPFLLSFYYALVDNNISRNFVGINNFLDLFKNEAFILGFKNTLLFMIISVPINIVISFLFSLLINQKRSFSVIFLTMFLIPLALPSAAMAYFWQIIFNINGVLNEIFFYDNPVEWINSKYSMMIIIIIFLWKYLGYNTVLFLSGLKSIPNDYYEYATVEGANKFFLFKNITLVYLLPTTFVVIIMSVLNSFKSFKEIYILAGDYPDSKIYLLQHFMNNQFMASNYQKISASSYVLSIVIFAFSLIIILLNNKISKDL